jgi:flagellar hook assembly protein FlgD
LSSNPFTNSVVITYYPESSNVSSCTMPAIAIYNITGRLVRIIDVPSVVLCEPAQIIWNGNDNYGVSLPAGVYFCHVRAGTNTICKKIIKLR